MLNSLLPVLPKLLAVPLASMPELGPTAELLFAEAFDKKVMSRARFGAHFLSVMGMTPFEYLARWRIGVAQAMMKKGESLKMVAPAVGYTSAGALSRSFSQHVGLSPIAWLHAQRGAEIERLNGRPDSEACG